MQPRTRQALKLAVSAACLTGAWLWIDPVDFARRLRGTSLLPLAAAMALNLLLQVLNAAKLRILLPAPRPSLAGLTRVNLVAVFLAAFLPGGVGGEVGGWAYLSRSTGSRGRAFAAILLDRITGLWAQILLALLAWLWMARGSAALPGAVVAALALLGASLWAGLHGYRVLVRWARRFAARWRGEAAEVPEDAGDALAGLLAGRRRVLAVAALSLLNQGLVVAAFLLLDRSIGGRLGWDQAMVVLLLYTVALLAPIALGNWGLSEGALGALYHYAGPGSAAGVLLSLLLRLMALPAALLGWILFLRGGAGLRAAAVPAWSGRETTG